MKPKEMKGLGIIFLVIGIVSFALAFLYWMSFAFILSSERTEYVVLPFILFVIFVFLSYFAYGAIPLLVISGIKLRREKEKKNRLIHTVTALNAALKNRKMLFSAVSAEKNSTENFT